MSFFSKYRKTGKRIPLFYYMGYGLGLLIPRFLLRMKRRRLLRNWKQRSDAAEIRNRVDIYCRITTPFELPAKKTVAIKDVSPGRFRSRYAIDANAVLRYWPKNLSVCLHDGDTWGNPDFPTLIKARRLGDGKEANSVLLNLDSLRHFQRPQDNIPFEEKKPMLFFRGDIFDKPSRIAFFEKWANHPLLDIGDTNTEHRSKWHKPFCSMQDHFGYRFILAIEGYDMASSLQWIMASGCIPVMPRPTAEGWLMHSQLIPGVHYIEISPDFSDVGEKIEYYATHPKEAEKIARNSTAWADRFNNPERELIISLLVTGRYFSLSGQISDKTFDL